MADATVDDVDTGTPKKSAKPLLAGLAGAVILGAGGFYATYSGLVLGPKPAAADFAPSETAPSGRVAFVTLPPLTISLGKAASARHLRFSGSLDVLPEAEEEVNTLTPRILDALNTYLRAVSEAELEDPASMNRLRAQMLRRVQVVAGEENVRDLLITEFILN